MPSKRLKTIKKQFKIFWSKPQSKWAGLSAAAVIGIVGVLMLIYHLTYTQKVFPKVMVGSIDLSNLTINEAEGRLNQYIPLKPPVMEIGFSEDMWPVDLTELQVRYSSRETAQRAYLLGRGGQLREDLATKWRLWWQGERVEMKFRINEEKLAEALNLLIGQIEEPSIMPALVLEDNGEVILVPGKNGRVVNREKLEALVRERIGSLDFGQVEIPTELVMVEVSGENLAQAQERAEGLKTKEIKFSYDSVTQTVKGQELLDLINFEGGFDEVKIASKAAQLAAVIDRQPQNASFQFDGAKVVEFKPALPGLKLDQKEAKKLIAEGLNQLEQAEGLEPVTVKLAVVETQPAIKTEEVNDLGIKERIGLGESTFHGSIPNREHNIALTGVLINGVLIPPGEVFSFNQRVGDISAATGYQSAYIIKDGRTILGDGGGVCQVSTTAFRAALDAGLPIIERHPHSYRVSYYEQNALAGIDATVYAPSVDLKFKNDTPAHILIQTLVDTGSNYMKVEIYGTSDGRRATISNVRMWGQSPPPPDLYQDDPTLPAGVVRQVDWKAWGAKTAFDWTVTRNGEVIQKRTFYSSFQPWQAVFLRGVGG